MIATLLGLLVAGPARAEPAAEVLALTRALAYDRRLSERVGREIRVAVVHDPEDAASVSRAGHVRAALERMTPFTIQGRPVVLTEFPHDADEIDVIYVCTEQLPPVLANPPFQPSWVVLGFGRQIVKDGAHLSIVDRLDGLQLVVNLPASRAAGVDFSSRLLQVAQVLR